MKLPLHCKFSSTRGNACSNSKIWGMPHNYTTVNGRIRSQKGVRDNFGYCTLLLKKFPSKSDLSLLKVISIHIFSQHILQSIKIQPLYMYCPLLDKKKLWQAFTTDMYMYICTLCRKNEQSIIEICKKKNSEILHFFIFLHYKSKKMKQIYFFEIVLQTCQIFELFFVKFLYIYL